VIEREFERVRPVRIAGLPRFVGGAVGYLSYDIVRGIERLPGTAVDELGLPDAAFMLVDTLVIFDHAKHQLIVLANAHNQDDPDAAYDDAVRRIDQVVEILGGPLPYLRAGEPSLDAELQSNVTRSRFEAKVAPRRLHRRQGRLPDRTVGSQPPHCAHRSPIYRALRALNPSPYMFFLDFCGDLSLIGASPEMMVRLEEGVATMRPIAGTRPRGATDEEDKRLETELLADPKERAEHVMLVDLGRNDLGRVCDYGTVKVPRMMYVERYSHVMHIVSQVEGRLRAGMNAFDLLRATLPAGTLSGAPKVRAMEIIEELEGTRRGPTAARWATSASTARWTPASRSAHW
jgi:anthranilate synthase component 1